MRMFRGGLAVALGFVTATAARGAPQLTELDAPGAAKVINQACQPACGTLAYGINSSGAVAGYFTNKDVVPYAFLRSPTGHFTHFEAKGAGLGHGLDEGTVATAVNDGGEIAGQYQDANLVFHGYLRKADGHITRFDAPDAGTAAGQGTQAITINNAGTQAGVYVDASGETHGFVRVHGSITSFDPPGSIGTFVFYNSINNAGTVAGLYVDANLVRHGYVRAADGSISSIDCPGAGTGAGEGTFIEGINGSGEMTGLLIATGNDYTGIVVTPGGSCTDFNVPGAGPGGTAGVSIDGAGTVAGFYLDINGATHGFVRYPNGGFSKFSAPDAGRGTGQGTIAWSDHGPDGEVAGTYVDSAGLNHGFTWKR